MARLQDQNFEHQNVIVGRSAALRPIAPGRGALKIGSKDLKIDDLIEPLKIVALRGNVLQTFVDIKKSRVSDHPTIPSETRKGNHKSTLTAAVFGGVQLPSDDVTREVVKDGRKIEPAPTDDLQIGEIGLPKL